jgi:hypothetical protein
VTSLADVHRALAEQVRARIQRDVNVSPWPFSQMPVPRIEVWPADNYLNYYELSDSDDAVAPVQLELVVETSTDPESGFIVLTDLLDWEGPSSLRAAVMSDRTLGGTVDDCVVSSAQWETDEVVLRGRVPVYIVVTKG